MADWLTSPAGVAYWALLESFFSFMAGYPIPFVVAAAETLFGFTGSPATALAIPFFSTFKKLVESPDSNYADTGTPLELPPCLVDSF